MGVASSTWSLGAICVITGLALFSAQRAVAASLGERAAAQPCAA